MLLENTINDLFSEIIKNYGMNIVSISNNEVVLTKDDFLLSFLLHNGEVDIVYIFRDKDNKIYKCLIGSYLAASFNDMDRIGITYTSDIEDRIVSELTVISRGLNRSWMALLNGDRGWIDDYKKFFLSMPIRKISNKEYEIYSRII